MHTHTRTELPFCHTTAITLGDSFTRQFLVVMVVEVAVDKLPVIEKEDEEVTETTTVPQQSVPNLVNKAVKLG